MILLDILGHMLSIYNWFLSLSLCLSIAYLGRSANSFEYNMGLDIFGISMGICFGSINDIFNKRTCPIGSETVRTW